MTVIDLVGRRVGMGCDKVGQDRNRRDQWVFIQLNQGQGQGQGVEGNGTEVCH